MPAFFDVPSLPDMLEDLFSGDDLDTFLEGGAASGAAISPWAETFSMPPDSGSDALSSIQLSARTASQQRKRGASSSLQSESKRSKQQQHEQLDSAFAAEAPPAPTSCVFDEPLSSRPFSLLVPSPCPSAVDGADGGGASADAAAAAPPSPSLSSTTAPPSPSSDERKERRLQRNRASAQLHRERKRAYVQQLEGQVRERDEQLAVATKTLAALRAELTAVREQRHLPLSGFTSVVSSNSLASLDGTISPLSVSPPPSVSASDRSDSDCGSECASAQNIIDVLDLDLSSCVQSSSFIVPF